MASRSERAIRRDVPRPTVHARNLFHVSIAMWDAWAAGDRKGALAAISDEMVDGIDIMGDHDGVAPVNEPMLGWYLGPFLSDLPGFGSAALDSHNFTLRQVQEAGFAGVQNFPTVGLIDGTFRANLEETGMGYGLEVEMIRLAHERDLLTAPYVFDVDSAIAMAEAGADIFCIDARNSAFVLVLPSLSNTTSICSTGESGFSTRRMTQMRLRSSLPMRSSSLRVPLLWRSIAGNRRLSESRLSR